MFFDRQRSMWRPGMAATAAFLFVGSIHVPRGGPDGGDGGHGGDVVLVVDPQVRDLQLFTYRVHFKAGVGQAGMGAKKHGANGDTVRIPGPLGTQVWVEEETGDRLIADLARRGQELVDRARRSRAAGAIPASRTRFAKHPSSASWAKPERASGCASRSSWWPTWVWPGFPTPGSLSAAAIVQRQAQSGRLSVHHHRALLGWSSGRPSGDVFTVADVPGLLEGASDGVGLGHEFLAHLERCFLLLHVVDVTGSNGADPVEGFRAILRELDAHARGLAAKPQLVVLNKIDAVTPAELEAQTEAFMRRGRAVEG